IPADAGNTQIMSQGVTLQPVYPRWRGEHLSVTEKRQMPCGLSPLARGTHVLPQHQRCNCRFIPAGAGNTLISTCKPWGFAVYPRWRGEHFSALNSRYTVAGLSPLARGTPLLEPSEH
ncbi:hypothetical protein SEEU9261_05784, partial [Salmonella enterica subsp. enterica serovar Urbana str. ATCC 9261]